MTLAPLALSIILLMALGAVVIWIARREFSRLIQDKVRESFRLAVADFSDMASQRQATERAERMGDLDVHRKEVEKVVENLERQLSRHEQLVRDLEHDRASKYGSLERQLSITAAETRRLNQATAQLTSMLGNAKMRGQWGEKTADDILRLCGLQEGIHYTKQKNAPIGRPDFTFLLPGNQKLYMDVKFPLDNYIKLANCDMVDAQKVLREQFLRDVKAHLRDLERRDYAPEGSESPDIVIMFIPNEQVYGAVNEWMHGLIDEALSRRVVVCGPWTLYAQVRVIWQAWQNYYHAQTIGDITRTVSEFLKAYERFKDRFTDVGKKLEAVSQKYAEVTEKSYPQLDRKIQRIEAYRKGKGVEMPISLEDDSAEEVSLTEHSERKSMAECDPTASG